MRQANAVSARMELDLRVGAALTRTQTIGLQGKIAALTNVVSYGTVPLVYISLDRAQISGQAPASSRRSASSSTSTSASRRLSRKTSGTSTSRLRGRTRPSRSLGAEEGSTTRTSPTSSSACARTSPRQPSFARTRSRRRSGPFFWPPGSLCVALRLRSLEGSRYRSRRWNCRRPARDCSA